jgi:mono/diheme cytochrome c family protein
MGRRSFNCIKGNFLFVAIFAVLLMIARSGIASQGSSKPTGSKPIAKVEPPADTSEPDGDPASGARLYQNAGCADCHGPDAEGAIGPPIVKVKETFQEFEKVVRKPTGAMPNAFPADLVSEDELTDIYAFLEHPPGPPPAAEKPKVAAVNPAPKGDAENGKKVFVSHDCDKCHTLDQRSGGPNAIANIVPDSLLGMIDDVRHSKGNMPAFNAAAISDQELADIYAYMKSLTKP